MIRPLSLSPLPRRGVIIVAVLVVVVVLLLAAYHYADLMTSEYRASANAHRGAQARAWADSGIHYAAALLATPDNVANLLGDNPWNNPAMFRNVAVDADADVGWPGKFSLVAPADSGGETADVCRYGVTDEGGKINLNALMKLDASGQVLHDMLVKLPSMTDEVASAIVDWLDPDSEPRTGGAEDEYYSAQTPPYRAKNGPLDSLDELLLVKGVTPELLFGADQNRNGVLDEGEEDTAGTGLRGWSAFLTIYSREQVRDAAGNPLLNINDDDVQNLYTTLSTQVGDDLAKYIVMYRQNGPASSSGGQQSFLSSLAALGGGTSKSSSTNTNTVQGKLGDYTLDPTKSGKTQLTSLFDLVNTQVSIKTSTKDARGRKTTVTTLYTSPLTDAGPQRELLPKLFAAVTVAAQTAIPARINVNTAPPEVLAALPELTEADVQNLTSARPKTGAAEKPDAIYQTPAWLLTEARIRPQTLGKIEKYVTTKTQVYRVQSVGYGDGAGPSAHLEAVIDANGGRPRILAWRDLSELGKGYIPQQ